MQKSIKLNPELWKRVTDCAKKAGYSSPQEFVEHVLEKELARLEDEEAEQEIVKKMRGLGYLE